MDGRLTLGAFAIAFLAWIGIVLMTWPTYEGLNHASGNVAACADAVIHKEAPGHSSSDLFLATLYFPPEPLIVAAFRGTGMSWRAAFRWEGLLTSLALLAATALAAHALGGGGVAMTVALSGLLVSFPFVRSSIGGRADGLAAALSIAALAAWCRDPRRKGWWTAVLAAAAWLVKATSVTVPAAVLLASFGPGARRAAGPFAARFFAAIAAGMALLIPWHGPAWYGDVLHTLLLAPGGRSILARGPLEILRYLASYSELAVLAGLAIVFLTGEWSRGRPVRPFAILSLAIAVVVLMNRAADHSHLLELTALAAVSAGLWAEHATRREAVLGLALVLIVVCGAAWREVHEAAGVAFAPSIRHDQVIAAVRATPGPVLCEDPLVALAAGRRAEISDAAILKWRLQRNDPRAREILARIESERYDLVVLNENLAGERNHWYRDFQFGESYVAALETRYAAAGMADGYCLYRPIRPEPPPGTSPSRP